ncbi:MAG: flagellar hook protein [Deltaproteobacteria bacterium]|nr:MAG: flagellar hook protein [Deltaproteobacteria bacterium]
MSLSTNLVAGLSSGFDWRTMIDQLIAIEHRRVDLVEDQKTEYESKLEIFQSINTKLLSFKTQAETLADSDAFNVFTTSLSTDSSTYNASDFLSVSTSTSAAPGSHTITMNSNSTVAQARQISSKSFTSYDTALSLSGEFVINGRAVEVETSDTLADIRDKINNLNSGTNATEVTASIMTVSSSNYRLILTSDETGEDAFTIFDASADTVNVLSSGLGFTDGTTTVKNLISNGAQSEAFSSATQAVSSMLGLNTAQSGTVTIGSASDPNQFTVTINLSDSLTDIAGDINTAASDAGSSVTASVVSTTEDGVTTYRLKIENTTNFTDANNVLQTLGILEGDQGSVAEVHLSDTANTKTTAAGGGDVVATTVWGDINTGGDANNITNGDTITFTGFNHIGTSISGSYTITDKTTDQVQGLLTAIQNAFAAVDGGAYTVTASVENGKIKITDDTTGDSQLTLSVTCNNEGGGTLDLGTITASTEGYTMQVQAGQDANIIIDGTAVTSSSNIIDDVIAGVTLNLLTVEELTGTDTTTVTLTVSRDYDTIKSSVQNLLDEYNDVMSDINEQFAYDEDTETGGLLQGDGTLHSIKSDLVDIVVSTITGLPSTLNALSLIGITSDDDGMLSIDDDDFKDAFNDNFSGLRRIFVAEGSTTDGDVEYIGHSYETVAGEYTINITQAATQAQVTGTTVLTSGIGSANIETLTITQGSKTAAITLNGASGENGSSIDNIVNAINSELDTEYAQSIMGNVKNTTDAAQTTAITNTTTWDAVYSGGVAAGLSDGDVITFTGHKKNGTEVSGSYTISDVTSDTVQGLLSAIEAAYEYEVSAAINTYGYLVITDNTTGNSDLDITITEPSGTSLDFGAVTTSNLVGSVRNTTDGTTAITASNLWSDIQGSTVTTGDTFKFSGYTVDGNAVEGSYSVGDVLVDTVDDFLTEIETAYNAAGGSVTAEIQDGRIVIKDGTTNSTLGIEIFEPTGKGVDFGTLSGGVTGRYSVDVTASKDASDYLVLTHDEYGSSQSFTIQVSGTDLGLTDNQTYTGVDVAGTINGEAATGSGQLLTGDAPASGETTSVEGLTIKYTGTTTGSQGTVKITMGVAELFNRALYDITNVSDGYLDYKIESVSDRIDDLEDDIEEMEARLDRKMERMINQFVAMELALAQIQNQSAWLTGQINASNSAWSW